MVATLIIVFREMLEAGLVIGIVLAATVGIPRRGLWVGGGGVLGLAGATLVAVFAGAIADGLSGFGQEVFNAAVLFTAVVMLGWHNAWMQRHGREMAADMTAVGRAVAAGERPLAALAIVIGVAVLREGAEVVLFLYGIAADADAARGSMLLGGALGIAGGAAVSIALYAGLLKLSQRRLFAVTSWLITLLAAGMAAQGAGYLIAADMAPSLGDQLWDTSALLSDHSIPGLVLRTLVGYIDRPAGLQVIAWLVTVLGISALTGALRPGHARPLHAA